MQYTVYRLSRWYLLLTSNGPVCIYDMDENIPVSLLSGFVCRFYCLMMIWWISIDRSLSIYIVERSINLAYSAVETFPNAKVHITNELIHNPMVNDRLHFKNVNFIQKLERTTEEEEDTTTDEKSESSSSTTTKKNNNNAILDANPNAKDFSDIQEGDVVMLPAFGATLDEMK